MLKRILSIILCLSIFVCSVFMFIPFSVKANSIYNTIYDGFDYSSVISQHKTFSFTDKGGKKHTVFKATSSSAWICVFGEHQVIGDDDELNYYLSWYSYTGYQSKLNVFFQFLAAQMGIITKGASTILEDAINNSSSVDVDYDDTNGLTISSDSVDKLRKQLKNQYYDSIGIVHLNIKNERMSFSSTWFEEQDDYTSAYNLINSYDYQFMLDASFYGYDGREIGLYGFNRSAFNYCYLDGTKMCFVDTSLNNIPQADVFNYIPTIYQFDEDVHNSLVFASMYTKNSSYYSRYWDIEYSYKAISRGSWCSIVYSTKYNDFLFFKSYEALYNYLHGDQNAYLSSKIEETGEDIKISIDDMNTNISDKMDELIDSINSKKDGMSADELQNAIDKGLESISGKMDDIKDNTEETNTKLDTLLSAMQSQNEILMNILGVTTDIYNVVSSKDNEDDTNYTIADLQPHFNKCFTAVKNMVLYGESSFEDVGTQSVMNVDNDVGIAVYADDPENHVKDYHNGLLGKFPFCVPYQLYEWLQVLQADPKTPEFTYDYGYMLKYFGVSSDTDTVIKFDLSQYDDWAKNARSFLKLSFTLAVAVGTYRKFKGEI